MRALRVLLAFLLSAGPVQAQPVVDLLSGYSIPADQEAAAASEGDAPPGSGKQLAALEANLALLSEGLEGFAHPLDADKALLAAKPRLPSGTAPFFKDRATALNALYRTLAVVDYTWALRFPNPPCAPAVKRSALLRSDDGLFLDTFSGETSAWMTALLGPSAKGKDLESSLDQASASAAPTRAEYARLRARLNQVTKALAAEDAVAEARAELYCKRAETRVNLAAANRVPELVLAARSSEEKISRQGVVIIAGITDDGLEARGAGVVVDTKSGIRVLTDLRLGKGEVVALFYDNNAPVPLIVEREDAVSGLLLLRPEGDLGEPLILASAAPKKDELVFALAHSDRLGAWTKSQGLVTHSGSGCFQTDAVADASMAGGAVLDEEGRLAGLLVLRRAEGSMIDWPVAVPAPLLRAWIYGGEVPAPSPIPLTDEGTTKILTASRPLLQSVAVGAGAITAGYGFDTQTQWGSVHATCVANCSDAAPRSSYSDRGSADRDDALARLVIFGGGALIFKGIPALFRGIGSLFKSKPRAAIVKSSPAPRIPDAKPTVPDPPKEPPKIECTLTPVGAPESMGVETVEVIVQLKCPGLPEAELRGKTITFTLGWDEQKAPRKAIEAVTDDRGYASFAFYIDNEVARAERSFDDLDRYDPDNTRSPDVELIIATEESPIQNASRVEGPINAADPKPARVETKPPKKPPFDSDKATLALIGQGKSIRAEAIFAGGPVVGLLAETAPAIGAGALTGPAGLVILGAMAIITVRSGLTTLVAEHDKRTDAIDTLKPIQPVAYKQDKFDELDDEARKDRDEERKDCPEASDWQLRRAGLLGKEHVFKTEHDAIPNSRFDICACTDGSIIIKAHGNCGKPGPLIPTSARWK